MMPCPRRPFLRETYDRTPAYDGAGNPATAAAPSSLRPVRKWQSNPPLEPAAAAPPPFRPMPHRRLIGCAAGLPILLLCVPTSHSVALAFLHLPTRGGRRCLKSSSPTRNDGGAGWLVTSFGNVRTRSGGRAPCSGLRRPGAKRKEEIGKGPRRARPLVASLRARVRLRGSQRKHTNKQEYPAPRAGPSTMGGC